MLNITIQGEPYFYREVDRTLFLWMNITRSKYTLVSKGEFILLDRHFNCFFMTAKQMEVCIASDFRKWKRPDLELPPPDEDADAP